MDASASNVSLERTDKSFVRTSACATFYLSPPPPCPPPPDSKAAIHERMRKKWGAVAGGSPQDISRFFLCVTINREGSSSPPPPPSPLVQSPEGAEGQIERKVRVLLRMEVREEVQCKTATERNGACHENQEAGGRRIPKRKKRPHESGCMLLLVYI